MGCLTLTTVVLMLMVVIVVVVVIMAVLGFLLFRAVITACGGTTLFDPSLDVSFSGLHFVDFVDFANVSRGFAFFFVVVVFVVFDLLGGCFGWAGGS